MKRKVLLVGWDAADWKVINPLMDRGFMPTVQSLIEGGVMASIATLSPVLSPMLWTSIATGKRPYKHGILGFIEPAADGSGIQPVTNLSRKTKAIWNILTQNGLKSNVVGWWPSHPAEPIDGVMVSNHYQRAPGPIAKGWPMKEGTVHPERLRDVMMELRVHPQELGAEHVLPFVPLGERIDQDKDRRLESLVKILADCTTVHSAATHLIENEPWDFMAVYYDAIDHFCHGFMKYHPPRLAWVKEEDYEIYKNVIAAGYVYHDMMLARLIELAGPDTTVILMSDHGFHPDHLRRKALPMEPAGPAAEHRDLGIFVMNGPGIRKDTLLHGVNLLDVAPTVLTLFGLPIDEQMDGRPLVEAFNVEPKIKKVPDWDKVPGEAGRHSADRALSMSETREGIDQLVALGYIDKPSDDKEKAINDCVREMNYNLARAYMDGGMHGLAAPLLIELYKENPIELRFGTQLAICLQSMQAHEDLGRLVDDLNKRWRKIADAAREQLKDITTIAKERRAHRKSLAEAGAHAEGGMNGAPKGDLAAPEEGAPDGKSEKVFTRAEQMVIRKLRAIAKGNAQALDFLAGWLAIANNDYESALEHLEKADTEQLKSPGFHLQLGDAYRRLKRYKDAITSFERALELDPENPNAFLGLARAYLGLHKNRKALEAAQTAIGYKYHLPPAHFVLGTAKMRRRDFDGAIKSLQTALEQNPNFFEAHVRLARIYRRALNKPKLAVMHENDARDIREARRKRRRENILPDLTPLDAIDFHAELPKFPTLDNKGQKLPSLGEPAQRRPKPDEAGDLSKTIVVVSGLPRSGTSMAMQMLEAAGLNIFTDGKRVADENNPRGYFEMERVKQLATCNNWLGEAVGMAIKVVAPQIPHLPQGFTYRVILMDRELDEVIASQANMLERLGRQATSLEDAKLKEFLKGQMLHAINCLAFQQIPSIVIPHQRALEEPATVAQALSDFLGGGLDIAAMTAVVDKRLHRERATDAATAGR